MSVRIQALVDPAVLRGALGPDAVDRLDALLEEVRGDPSRLGRTFPAAARRTGRGPLPDDPAGTLVEDAVRVELAAAAAAQLEPEAFLDELRAVYRYGDGDEKRAVLRVLDGAGDALDGRDLLLDALRTNDTRLVGAAMGPHAVRLRDDEWRHGVLKCLFTGVPVGLVHDLGGRADAELDDMARRYAREREAAGRPVPHDVQVVLDACSPTEDP